jgi:acetolactate synthase-1/2/3 large subunit
MLKMRGAEAMVKALEKEGVKYVFGHPGHGNMNILDAIYDSEQITFKLVRHELAAAHVADGYARISGELGVCCSSVGPGATNMITGIASAFFTSTPLLVISGGIISKWTGRGQLQETSRSETPTDQCYIQAIQPFVKKVWHIHNIERIPEIIRKACTIARSGRPGPVAIEIPWDMQAESYDFEIPEPSNYSYSNRIRADLEMTRKTADALLDAKHPLIMTGYGAVLSEAEKEVEELANLLGAPVATSFSAKGILPEDHLLSVGITGWLGHPVAHEMIRQHADLILVVGFRFSDQSTSWWTEGLPFVTENRFIQIDIDSQEIGKIYPVEIGLLGDVKSILSEIISILKSRPVRENKQESLKLVEKVKEGFVLVIPDEPKSPMEPMKVADELRKLLPRDSILAIDTGNHAHYFASFYPIYGSRRVLNSFGWTPMGFAPTAIIGAKLANPDRDCVCVTGDGGFSMVCQEVITAVEWETPIVWIVFNDMNLTAIREGQKAAYNGRIIGTEFTQRASFATLAEAFQAEGVRVNHYHEIEGAVDHALKCGKPCVIDMMIEPDPVPPPLAGAWCEPVRGWLKPLPRGSKEFDV